jgi:hypothetical protein
MHSPYVWEVFIRLRCPLPLFTNSLRFWKTHHSCIIGSKMSCTEFQKSTWAVWNRLFEIWSSVFGLPRSDVCIDSGACLQRNVGFDCVLTGHQQIHQYKQVWLGVCVPMRVVCMFNSITSVSDAMHHSIVMFALVHRCNSESAPTPRALICTSCWLHDSYLRARPRLIGRRIRTCPMN